MTIETRKVIVEIIVESDDRCSDLCMYEETGGPIHKRRCNLFGAAKRIGERCYDCKKAEVKP